MYSTDSNILIHVFCIYVHIHNVHVHECKFLFKSPAKSIQYMYLAIFCLCVKTWCSLRFCSLTVAFSTDKKSFTRVSEFLLVTFHIDLS